MPTPDCQIAIKTPLKEGSVRLRSCRARESLSTLGEMAISVLSDDAEIAGDKILGKPVTVSASLHGEVVRELSGYVTRFAHTGTDGRFHVYELVVRPWLWLLTRTTDCRIFQDMTVPDIVKAVFADHPVAACQFKLFRSYRTWTYCVQYRETDFDFVARLLEHEGIYWYFAHAGGKHTLVLVDASSAHDAVAGEATLPFHGDAGEATPGLDFVDRWSTARSIRPGTVVLTDHDFERPAAAMKTQHACPRTYDLSDGEVFDYPGGYLKSGDGAQYAENRIEELQAGFELACGSANTVRLAPGVTFKLARHPRRDQNAEYLVTATTVDIRHPGHESGSGPAVLRCDFDALPAKQQYRPARRTPKPCIGGPQTAVVVGKGGEEIFTDKYGRVKVQFHWDRRGANDERSSCWLRVSHPWAGKNFGVAHVPRIGQEVIVGFLDGDPDCPIVIGRVHNADQMPPWDLPGNATQSGILTRSSKGGSAANANALRFEDKTGAEQVWLHAERNQDIEVEKDETHWVGHDRAKTVDHDETVQVKHDRSEKVGHDEHIEIGHDQGVKIVQDQSIDVGRDRRMDIGRDKLESVTRDKNIRVRGSHSEVIGDSMSVTVASTLTESVGVNYAESVGGAMELSVGGALAITVGAAMAETVAGVKSEAIGGSKSETVGGAKSVTVTKDFTETVTAGGYTLKVSKDAKWEIEGEHEMVVTKGSMLKAKKVQVTAEEKLTLKCGDAEIVLNSNGNITLTGKTIKVDGSSYVVKADKVAEN